MSSTTVSHLCSHFPDHLNISDTLATTLFAIPVPAKEKVLPTPAIIHLPSQYGTVEHNKHYTMWPQMEYAYRWPPAM